MTDNSTPQYQAMLCDGLPTSCVKYGVVDTLTGKEVCRVWEEGDCQTIADLLNESPCEWDGPLSADEEQMIEDGLRTLKNAKPRPTRQEARDMLADMHDWIDYSSLGLNDGYYDNEPPVKAILDAISGEE
jgi:hypothetical protein